MDRRFRNIGYLQCDPKYRVNEESLNRVIQMTIESGLSTTQPCPEKIIKDEELSELLIMNEMLISACRPIMTKVFDSFTDKTKLMFLCDQKGFIIDLFSSTEIMQWAFSQGIKLGACLDYYSFGTNSISMAIYEKSPVVIIGDEHYCEVLKSWSCIAAPVKVDREIAGYINISSGANSDLVQLIALVEVMAELAGNYMQMMRQRSRGEKNNTEGENSATRSGKVNNSTYNENMYSFFGKLVLADLGLTHREVEILWGMYCGNDNEKIAMDLNISKNTVKSHLKNVYQKLGVNNHYGCVVKVREILSQLS